MRHDVEFSYGTVAIETYWKYATKNQNEKKKNNKIWAVKVVHNLFKLP